MEMAASKVKKSVAEEGGRGKSGRETESAILLFWQMCFYFLSSFALMGNTSTLILHTHVCVDPMFGYL